MVVFCGQNAKILVHFAVKMDKYGLCFATKLVNNRLCFATKMAKLGLCFAIIPAKVVNTRTMLMSLLLLALGKKNLRPHTKECD